MQYQSQEEFGVVARGDDAAQQLSDKSESHPYDKSCFMCSF